MKRTGFRLFVAGAMIAAAVVVGDAPPARIAIDYPAEGSIFPPEITAPTFLWRDPAESAATWLIDVEFTDGSASLQLSTRGEAMRSGAIDPRAVAKTNEPPKLTPEQATTRSWIPDAESWAAIKKHTAEHPAKITISGFRDLESGICVSRGSVSIVTSRDPVGAPIFYRDVPLMPSETAKGLIKPLDRSALPLISWRLRDISLPDSRIVLDGLHTCANCHSFSRDGRTLGMDVDGPENEKGTYAIAPVVPNMSVRNEDVISWNSFPGKAPERPTIGFLSQISPDGQYAVTTVNEEVYVANFKDYRFLQVFYPTRGILAWYHRASGRMQALPGADDPRYVHTDAVWSPDGKYLVFARAEARDAYPAGRELAKHANDPAEIPIQYDLYRIPFNSGKGGRPEAIAGAARNGMSNNFPKISPDGRWIVFVQCRNGQLLRPDSQLYIVPAEGGSARRMHCNTPLMNSWHSFSPNGRWLVFSSKSRSPYTQMFLTHLDENGQDSPAILIENATAADRAVNIPEFVNIPPKGLLKIDMPAAEFYRLFDLALALGEKGQFEAAIEEWRKALAISPDDAKAHNNLGVALAKTKKLDDAITHFRKAIALNPAYAQAHYNLGGALAKLERLDEAISAWRRAVEHGPQYAEIHNLLGRALAERSDFDQAITHFRKALEVDPKYVEAHYRLGMIFYSRGAVPEALAQFRQGLRLEPDYLPLLNQTARGLASCATPAVRNGNEALELAERALQLTGGKEPAILDTLAAAYAEVGRFPEAIETARRARALAVQQAKQPLADDLRARIALYEAETPYREGR